MLAYVKLDLHDVDCSKTCPYPVTSAQTIFESFFRSRKTASEVNIVIARDKSAIEDQSSTTKRKY